jgi:serine phosphatase RsbU (regulator of sigma subunit)/Tfp pilus assembly protein PilF
MKKAFLFFFLGMWCLCLGAYAQSKRMDSLQTLVKKLPDSKQKVEAINELAFEHIFYSYDTSMKYANEAESLADKIGYNVGKALSLNISGIVYRIQGNYSRALDSHFKSLSICEKENYPQGIANNYSNIGLVFFDKEDYKKAIEYYEKALKIKEKIDDKRGVAFSLNDIGGVYLKQGDLKKAEETYLKSIKLRESLEDTQGLATSLNNMGKIYFERGELVKALDYMERSLKIGKSFNDQLLIATNLNNLGGIFIKQEEYEKAKQNFTEALRIAKKINSKIEIKNAYQGLAKCHRALGEFDEAFENLEAFISIKDSLFNEENNKRTASLEYGYQLEIKEVELRRQNLIRNALIAGAVIIIIALLFIIRAIRQKRGAYQLLEAKKAEIEKQKDDIEGQKAALEQAYEEITQKNAQITSNVIYAKNIQKAILPDQDLDAYFDKYFVIFRPQYNVSGDFYWFRESKGKRFIAVADCTGKGVAGAFMSTISINILDEILNLKQIESPGEILEMFHAKLRLALRQDQQRNQDSVDIALCCIEETADQHKKITYAGAAIPLLYSNGWEINEIAPNKYPIGGSNKETRKFENHTIELKKDDYIYLISDGIINQPGSEQKRFGTTRLKETLKSMLPLGIEKQKEMLDSEIESQLQECKQKDDITALVVKLSTK